jgi:hypothetical protein
VNRLALAFAFLVLSWPQVAAAQSDDHQVEAAMQFAGIWSGEFDESDYGFGGRISWHPVSLVGIDAEVNFFPSDFPDGRAFSSSRFEGLFGATVGPRLGRVRPFGKVRPGFVGFEGASEPFACILIFPPPLSCTLAAGETLFALDLGGGIELFTSPRTFVRVDAGDRMVRYPAPVIRGDFSRRGEDAERSIENDPFFGHDFRFTVGGGMRF